MKKIIKRIIVAAVAVATVGALSSCSQWDTPFEELDESGSNVSVRFDVGEGMFAGATTDVFVIDVFNPTEFEKNSDGKHEIPLVEPDSKLRGDSAFEVSRTGYFLAGWYSERTLRTDADGNPLDEFGQLTSVSGKPQAYVYGGRWDFAKDRLEIDPDGEYSSENYTMTLYAAWIPYYTFEIYSADSAEPYETVTAKELRLPEWNGGALSMKNFPKRENKTLDGVYLDAEYATLASTNVTGTVDYGHGISLTPTVKVYTTWREGNWYRIETEEQFLKCASMDGSYELLADLDFDGRVWPKAFLQNAFTGSIVGNGHTMSNITVRQTDTQNIYAGLFGSVSDSASFENVTFENVTFCLFAGSRMNGAAFGLFSGSVASNAVFENVSVSGTFEIYPDVNVNNAGCSYGLVVGTGSVPTGLDATVTYELKDNGSIKNELAVTLDSETGELIITKADN